MILGGYTAAGPRDMNEDSSYSLDFSDVRSHTNGATSHTMVSDGAGGYQGSDDNSTEAVAPCVGSGQDELVERSKQPTARTNAVVQSQHTEPIQFGETAGSDEEDPLKGLDEFVAPELYDTPSYAAQQRWTSTPAQSADAAELEQYRLENYRGRSSEKGRGSSARGARPSVSQRGSSVPAQGGPKKAMVVPVAVGVVLLVALAAIALFAVQGGSGGAAPSQQSAAPSGAEQAGAGEASGSSLASGATNGTALAEYTVGTYAALKYIDSQGLAHTFNEGIQRGSGFTAVDDVVLVQGERVRASKEPVEVTELGRSYYVLADDLRQDLFNDLQSYHANSQVSFTSGLSALVRDEDAYRNLIKAISEYDAESAQLAIDKLVVSELDNYGNACLISSETSTTRG